MHKLISLQVECAINNEECDPKPAALPSQMRNAEWRWLTRRQRQRSEWTLNKSNAVWDIDEEQQTGLQLAKAKGFRFDLVYKKTNTDTCKVNGPPAHKPTLFSAVSSYCVAMHRFVPICIACHDPHGFQQVSEMFRCVFQGEHLHLLKLNVMLEEAGSLQKGGPLGESRFTWRCSSSASENCIDLSTTPSPLTAFLFLTGSSVMSS